MTDDIKDITKNVCPLCKRLWTEHDFGVPSPVCPNTVNDKISIPYDYKKRVEILEKENNNLRTKIFNLEDEKIQDQKINEDQWSWENLLDDYKCWSVAIANKLYMSENDFKKIKLEAEQAKKQLLTQLNRKNIPQKFVTPTCCVCGTTKNLHKDGWYGYRCNKTECVCF
jgi:hypothetical protein